MIKIYHCQRCEHDWPSRREAMPRWCPRCKTEFWQTKREPKLPSVRPEPRERSPRYPVFNLAVGQSIKFPWFILNGRPDVQKNELILRSIRYQEKKTGFRFRKQGTGAGLVVTRIS